MSNIYRGSLTPGVGSKARGDAADIDIADAGGLISATNVEDALQELATDMDNHLIDTADAHDASAISNVPAGNIGATDVQAAINELDTEKQALITASTADSVKDTLKLQVNGITALKALTPINGERIWLNYHTSEGDGGHGVFRTVTGAPASTYTDNNGTIILPTGGDGSAAWLREYSGYINVKWFGATGDGSTDDAPAINAADAFAATEGTNVFYPTGTYLVDRYATTSDSGTQYLCIGPSDNVYHIGEGRENVTVKNANGADSHTFYMYNKTGCGVMDMTIDGDRTNQTVQNPSTGNDPAGIICIGSATNIVLRRLLIKNTPDYGIGFEGTVNAQYCTVDDIIFDNTGADAFDAKNGSNGSKGNVIRNIVVKNINPSVGQSTQQAAINVRYGWILNNISIYGLISDHVGIRLNDGETADSGGFGAHNATLSNFHIQATTTGTTIGIMVDGRSCQVSNGFIGDTNRGIQVRQREAVVSNVYMEDIGANAIDAVIGSLTTPGERGAYNNITVRNAAGSGFRMETDENTLSNCIARSCGTGLNMISGANYNRFLGGGITNSTTTNVTDSGTGNVIQNVYNVETFTTVQSDTFAIDSTGTKTVTITHGLAFTPGASDCQLTILGASANDFAVDHIEIDAVSSTTVTAKVVVGTASASGGATARLALMVKVKH